MNFRNWCESTRHYEDQLKNYLMRTLTSNQMNNDSINEVMESFFRQNFPSMPYGRFATVVHDNNEDGRTSWEAATDISVYNINDLVNISFIAVGMSRNRILVAGVYFDGNLAGTPYRSIDELLDSWARQPHPL